MTPRRYLATTLTFDNRALDHTDNLQDEIRALRNGLRMAQERERVIILKLDALEAHNAELAELVLKRDEQIAAWNDGKEQA